MKQLRESILDSDFTGYHFEPLTKALHKLLYGALSKFEKKYKYPPVYAAEIESLYKSVKRHCIELEFLGTRTADNMLSREEFLKSKYNVMFLWWADRQPGKPVLEIVYKSPNYPKQWLHCISICNGGIDIAAEEDRRGCWPGSLSFVYEYVGAPEIVYDLALKFEEDYKKIVPEK